LIGVHGFLLINEVYICLRRKKIRLAHLSISLYPYVIDKTTPQRIEGK
jgi:hypothetical protein